MPKNVFDPKNQGEMNLKRNAYDLSKSSVFTTDFFKLYPHFCQEVIPGDTFEIDAQVGFRALPTTFPLQTRVRVSQEFYYCRNRTLQDNFEDMIFKTKEIEHPWLRLSPERAKKMISIGSLGDAFNVPCSVGSEGFLSGVKPDIIGNPAVFGYRPYILAQPSVSSIVSDFKILFSDPITNVNDFGHGSFVAIAVHLPSDFDLTSSSLFNWSFFSPASSSFSFTDCFVAHLCGDSEYPIVEPFRCSVNQNLDGVIQAVPFSARFVEFHNSHKDYPIVFFRAVFHQNSSNEYILIFNANNPFVFVGPVSSGFVSLDWSSVTVSDMYSSTVVDSTDDSFISSNPFVGENPQIRLNVLPFRAYTQVVNYYYRFDKNNPYVLNGEAQYNEFIPSHASGPDDNEYDFHYRNWELDRFTSALQSPQFGQAPLVGLIWTGDKTVDLTFSDPQTSDGETYKVTVGVDQDDNIESILDFSGDVPSADLQRLQRSIQAGLSINDLRVTNSFQRFLENVMRRGLRYRNQLKSHFGVSVDYPDIDIPQYIGGSSSYFDSGQVTNMAQGEAVLGDYNGTLQGGTATTNRIRCYCPEHGYIIGIVSITPIPSYAQAISKHMIKRDPFDYFTPEFGKIGFTPIHYSELAPLQNTGTQKPSDVFGYQKAWYDYMEALDEVHGDFRTTLRDFVLSRTFAERPQLSESFTVGSPDQLNDVFVTTKIADKYGSSAKFLGSARFYVRALRPIPMIGTPSLE